MATEDLVQKAQVSGGLIMSEESPDGDTQLVGLVASRKDVAKAARHAVTTLCSQASIVRGEVALLAGGNVGGQVRGVGRNG